MIDSYEEFLKKYAEKLRDIRFESFMKYCCEEYERDLEYGEYEPPEDD